MEKYWLALGFTAPLLFTARFLIQWIASERTGRSVIPVAFWFLSLSGGSLLLIYAMWRKDPVFIFGQCAGVFIYSRNLYLIYQERRGQKRAHVKSSGADPDQPQTSNRVKRN